MSRQETQFATPRKYLLALNDDPGLAMVPYSFAAHVFDVKVPTVQGYVRDGILREVVIGKDREWVGLLAADVSAERKRRRDAVMLHVPKARKILKRAARRGEVVEYGEDLMKPLGLNHAHAHDRDLIGKVLGQISTQTYRKDRPRHMLSVLAVRKTTGLPNEAFFGLARHLGALEEGADEEKFFRLEKRAVFRAYGAAAG